MDPHIFANPNPDPGSQNVADPTDTDPKHRSNVFELAHIELFSDP